MEKLKLDTLTLKGFKSIHPDGQTIRFDDITVLLGANGSGKSNLISFFKLLKALADKTLSTFVGRQGGAESLLYYGAKYTESIIFDVIFEFHEKQDRILFSGVLDYAPSDQLFFTPGPFWASHEEEELQKVSDHSLPGIEQSSREIQVFQFHDTSDTAKIKTSNYIDDAHSLHGDAGNLAAFLRALKTDHTKRRYYDRIIRHITRVMPQFGDFELRATPGNDNYVRLNWYESGNDFLFGPHQISDGSLRFMALATLLLQPPENLPGVIVLDEPELGLHPAAIAELAGMIRVASQHAQVIIATQSTRLVDEFDASNLVVVERDAEKHCSVFKRLDEDALADWLARYSLSELWEKNVLGGQP